MRPLFLPLVFFLLLCGCGRQKTFVPDVDDVLAGEPGTKRGVGRRKEESPENRAARGL